MDPGQLRADIETLTNRVDELRGDPGENSVLGSVSGESQSTLMLKPRRVLRGHFGKVYSLAWAGNSRNIVSASQDGKLLLWNAMTGNKVAAIPLRSSWVMTCAYSASGGKVASGGLDNVCSVYSVDQASASPNPRPVAELDGHEGYISCSKFVGDSKVVTSSGDATVAVWDVERRTRTDSLVGHDTDVMSISVSADGNIVVSGSCDATVRVWDVREPNRNRLVTTFRGHESDINSVDFNESLSVVATASDDSSCRLFDLRSSRGLGVYASTRILCGTTSVSLSSSGRYLFAGYDDNSAAAWDTLAGDMAQSINQHDGRVSCVEVSPDGKCLATGSWDSTLRCHA